MAANSPLDHIVNDLTFRYSINAVGGVGLEIFPRTLADQLVNLRSGLAGLPYIDALPAEGNSPARVLDSLVQVKIAGDSYTGGFAQGHTMRSSPSNDGFVFEDQTIKSENGKTTVLTTLRSARQHRLEHRLAWHEGDSAVEITSTFRNDSAESVTLEMLSSFSLGGITPFDSADAPGRLRVHRFRSAWSAEGRLETQSLEALHLERSWSGAGAFSERFGQVGTMPVRRWFPFVAVEDTVAGVVWGAQLAWAAPGSWRFSGNTMTSAFPVD